jgi:hypothetical protein
MLGPVRFTHIQDCARDVCRVFRVEDEMQDCISTLKSLDVILADLREELANVKKANHPSPDSEAKSRRTKKDYSTLQKSRDTVKVRRQISAREKAIESVKTLIGEERSSVPAFSLAS